MHDHFPLFQFSCLFHYAPVVGEEDDLGVLGQFGQEGEGRGGAPVVEVDEDVSAPMLKVLLAPV